MTQNSPDAVLVAPGTTCMTRKKESDESGAPCNYRKVCNWDTVDDSRKKGNWSHRLLLRQIQLNSNDRQAVWQRILKSSDSVQDVKTPGPWKHGSQGKTRQGGQQEWQVRSSSVPLPLIISTFLCRIRRIRRIQRHSPVSSVVGNPSRSSGSP